MIELIYEGNNRRRNLDSFSSHEKYKHDKHRIFIFIAIINKNITKQLSLYMKHIYMFAPNTVLELIFFRISAQNK